jgi:hypothetical protein
MIFTENKNSKQLRYYIALSAPPTREPADGTEEFMRPVVGFNPSWFHKYCGIDFTGEWHKNPERRLETYYIMRDEVRKRFPGKNIGGSMEDRAPDLLTGLYGTAVISSIFGQGIIYYKDKWPVGHGKTLSDEQADELEVPNLDNNEFFNDILTQVDKISALVGKVYGFLNWQGVLNNAFRMRGQQIFMDMLDNPARANHIFEVMTEFMIQGARKIYQKQKDTGVDYRFISTGNCVVNMISPDLYEEFVLPYDVKLSKAFESFGIHNCAWKVDPYMETYATIEKLGYIDMGFKSDFSKAKKLFPGARRNILYTSMDLKNKSDEEIYEYFEKIAEELAPCDVGLPDIEHDVPDERILYVMDLCEKFSAK